MGRMTVPPHGDSSQDSQEHDPSSPSIWWEAVELHVQSYSEHALEGQGIGKSGFFPAELQVLHRRVSDRSNVTDDSSSPPADAPYVMWAMMITADTTSTNKKKDHVQFEWFLRGWEAEATKEQEQVAQHCSGPSPSTMSQRQCAPLDAPYPYPVHQLVFPDVTNKHVMAATETDSEELRNCWMPDVYALPPVHNFGVYTYKGSFTSPPCTERVHWTVVDQPMVVSSEQLARLEYLILCAAQHTVLENEVDNATTSTCGRVTVASPQTGSTSRPPQPLEGRAVLHRCHEGPQVTKPDVGVVPYNTNNSTTASNHGHRRAVSKSMAFSSYHPHPTPAPVWEDSRGYWVGTMDFWDSEGHPAEPHFSSSHVQPGWAVPYPRQDVTVLWNRTFFHHYFMDTWYRVYRPIDASQSSFCTAPLPHHASNTIPDAASCGIHGWTDVGDTVGLSVSWKKTSTKSTKNTPQDQSVQLLFLHGMFDLSQTWSNNVFAGQRCATQRRPTGTIVPQDEHTLAMVVTNKPQQPSPHGHHKKKKSHGNDGATVNTAWWEWTHVESYNATSGTMTARGEYHIRNAPFPPYSQQSLVESYTLTAHAVTEEEFIAHLKQVQQDNQVLNPVTMGPECTPESPCATTTWPSTNSKEPRIRPGWKVVLVLGGLTIVAVAVLWIQHDLKELQKRSSSLGSSHRRNHSCRSNSSSRSHSSSVFHDDHSEWPLLDPVVLGKVFARLDKEGQGRVSRDQLWQYVTRCNMMTEPTFDRLWNVVATDQREPMGITLDQFLAFMTLYARPRLVLVPSHIPKHRPRRGLYAWSSLSSAGSSPSRCNNGMLLTVQTPNVNQGLLRSPHTSSSSSSAAAAAAGIWSAEEHERLMMADPSWNTTTTTTTTNLPNNNHALSEADRRWNQFRPPPATAGGSGTMV